MSLTLAGMALAAVAVPHVLRLDSASPVLAGSIWLAALALRALVALLGALFVILYLPTTQLFTLVAHWCWDAVIPLLATHLPLSGHAFGDVALLVPAALLVISLLSVVTGVWRATRRVARLLRHSAVGAGPGATVLLADGDVLVASAGLRRPCVVVSAGALLSFDDEELAASLEHERGHIARRHRYVLLLAELCRSAARFLPGTKAAVREFNFHVERDADRYAVQRHHDPAALASAICKAAIAPSLGATTLNLRGGVIARRIRLLLADEVRPARASVGGLRALAAGMATLILVSAAALPGSAHASYHAAGATQLARHCVSR